MNRNEIMNMLFILSHLTADYIEELQDIEKENFFKNPIYTMGFKHLASKFATQCKKKIELIDGVIPEDEEADQYNEQLKIVEDFMSFFVKGTKKHGIAYQLSIMRDFAEGEIKVMKEEQIKILSNN